MENMLNANTLSGTNAKTPAKNRSNIAVVGTRRSSGPPITAATSANGSHGKISSAMTPAVRTE